MKPLILIGGGGHCKSVIDVVESAGYTILGIMDMPEMVGTIGDTNLSPVTLEPENTRSNYWLNAVILKDRDAQQSFLQYTNDNGVMTRPIWELMNRLPMFEKCENDGLKNTIWFADRVVNIPSSVRVKA